MKNLNFIKIFFTSIIAFLTFFYQTIFIFAVEVGDFLEDKLPTVSRNNESASEVVSSVVVYLIGIVAILAIISITWAGIMMFLSIGDEAKFNKAKKILIMSLIGVGVAGGGYAMVTIISKLTIS